MAHSLRDVNRRVIGIFLVLLLLGAGAGYAWAAAGADDGPTRFAHAVPVPASSPSFPVVVEEPYADDIDFPTLEPDLRYDRHVLGDPPFQYSYRAPRGWLTSTIAANENRVVPPGTVDLGGYAMRVKVVGERKTTQEMVTQKLDALLLVEDDVEVLFQSADTLSFTFRSSQNWKRYNTFRWFDTGDGFATVEVSVNGREQDLRGLTDLLDQVSASIRRVG
jgi:hypothetical protein